MSGDKTAQGKMNVGVPVWIIILASVFAVSILALCLLGLKMNTQKRNGKTTEYQIGDLEGHVPLLENMHTDCHVPSSQPGFPQDNRKNGRRRSPRGSDETTYHPRSERRQFIRKNVLGLPAGTRSEDLEAQALSSV